MAAARKIFIYSEKTCIRTKDTQEPPEIVSDGINFITQAKQASCMLVTTYKSPHIVTTYKSPHREPSRTTVLTYICHARKR